MIPATRATASTSPLGTFPSAIARSVAGASEINPSATASRKLTGLADTSTIWARPPSSTWLNFAGFSRVLFIAPSLSQVRQRLALPEQFLHRVEPDHAGRIALRVAGLRMTLDKQAIDAGRDGRSRQQRGVLWISAAGISQAAGLLRRMGCIENHRHAERFHHRNAGEIIDEAVVSEKGAALGEHHFRVAHRANFLHRIAHLLR